EPDRKEFSVQRNMDLVRTILMRIEDSHSSSAVPPFGIAGYIPEQVEYHVRIMNEEGLIESGLNKGKGIPQSLTWKGHEFLDLARDQRRWNQAKVTIGRLGSAPISVWMKVLNDLMLNDLGVAS